MLFKKPPETEPSQDERLQQFLDKEGLLPASEAEVPASEVETPILAPETPAIEPQIPVSEPEIALAPPLRALPEGAFLNGELEIRRVLERGLVNQYLADDGEGEFFLVFEREQSAHAAATAPENRFFAGAKRFASEGREYGVTPFQKLVPLRDFAASANDEKLIGALKTLADSLAFARENGARPAHFAESLFVSSGDELGFFGFFDALEETPDEACDVSTLAALCRKLARDSFAAHATLRLDDEFGALPLCEETKTLIRAISQGQLPDLSSIRAAIDAFAPFGNGELTLELHVGMERELNEDSGLAWRMLRAGESGKIAFDVLAVADGMGGHEGGEVASSLALDTLQTSISRRLKINWNDNAAVLGAMREIGEEANAAVVSMNENPPYAAMRNKPGSTLVWAIRVGSRVFLGNIGDSRAYRWNAARGLERLSKDHSYVQDLIDAGRLKEEEAWGHPDGNVILSHVGMARGLMLDVTVRLLRAGDRLVLVSDGVVDTMRDPQIEEIIAQSHTSHELATKLVEKANENGGIDNISVVCLFGANPFA